MNTSLGAVAHTEYPISIWHLSTGDERHRRIGMSIVFNPFAMNQKWRKAGNSGFSRRAKSHWVL